MLLSFITSPIGRYLMMGVIALSLMSGAYLKGSKDSQLEALAKTQKDNEAIHAKQDVSVKKTQAVSTGLQEAITQYTNQREETNEHTLQTMDEMLEKYTRPIPHIPDVRVRAIYAPPAKDKQSRECPNISVTPPSIVVRAVHDWGFSPKDRQALIREAARADKAVTELNACKAFVKSIYKSHKDYKQVVEEFLYQK